MRTHYPHSSLSYEARRGCGGGVSMEAGNGGTRKGWGSSMNRKVEGFILSEAFVREVRIKC